MPRATGRPEGQDGRPPTLETVAARAGVSRATVSRVVNHDEHVDAALRRRVEQAITDLGYVPNRAARSLATRRANSVALVMREPVQFGAADPYLSSIVIAAGQSLIGSGLHLIVMMARDEPGESPVEYLRAGHVDGVLLISVHEADPLPRQLSRLGIPTVVGGRVPGPAPGLASVDVDNADGGRIAARHLLDLGRRRIGMICGPGDMTAAIDRLAGFRATLEAAGRPAGLIAAGDYTWDSGGAALTELLRRQPDLDGVFAANDLMGLGAVEALRQAGRRVPQDIAVVGFDDIELARHGDPPLTTVRQPVAEQARVMVDLLLRRRAGRPVPASTVLPVTLVRRGSA